MERKAMVVCALVCFLGVLFAALVFAAEGTRVKGVPRPHPRCFRLGFLWFWSVDPFTKKQWYDIKTPLLFTSRNVGKTLMSRTQGTKIASEGEKHRVFEVSLADLQNDEDQAYRKIRLREF
ncbi:hypothetical protein ZWY2020_028057 [Hordeum vulgare]|nr:hypothetical protein ZWY2020_028057 [Hordeum vulgare]